MLAHAAFRCHMHNEKRIHFDHNTNRTLDLACALIEISTIWLTMDRQAHLVDDSIGLPSLAIVGSMFAVSVILYMLRIYIRVIPRYQLNGSDYCASCALVSSTPAVLSQRESAENPLRRSQRPSHFPFSLQPLPLDWVVTGSLYPRRTALQYCAVSSQSQSRAYGLLLWQESPSRTSF